MGPSAAANRRSGFYHAGGAWLSEIGDGSAGMRIIQQLVQHSRMAEEVHMGWLTDLVQGVPVNAVLRERLALAEQRFKDLESENAKLKGQLAALTAEHEVLKKKVEHVPVAVVPPAETPDVHGGLYYFDGNRNDAYCPRCYEREAKKHHMAAAGSIGFVCTVCGNIVYCR
jgi:hypothetical protein